MNVLNAAAAALAWLGRQGTRAVAALVFIGIAVPPVDRLLKPFISEAIFLLLCLAFLRVDPAQVRGHLGRPRLILAATAWTMLVVPAAIGTICLLIGLDKSSPDLFLGLMLQAIASPMMSAPAFAALMGLDAALVLVTLIASTALTPLTAPVFAYLFIGPALTLSPLALGIKLFAILAGSLIVATVIRRLAGRVAIERRKPEIDGFNVLILFVFVASVMENVAERFYTDPLRMIGLAGLAFGTVLLVLGLTTILFVRAGRARAFALALMASQRNMGLMLAATGGVLPETVWLYFALCQFPIYLLPQILKPLAARLNAREGEAMPPPERSRR
jgi:BASS family bile acid:Na+ symporter